jgi:drug/metabolite transporter (DMT)-like permease
MLLSAVVCTGAAVTLTIGSAALGELRPGEVTLAGWGWLLGIAVVSTVVAVSLFFAGLKRVGPTAASVLSTVEPVVTVLLAFLVFGELLGAFQLLGGALVILAVVVLANNRQHDAPEGAPA